MPERKFGKQKMNDVILSEVTKSYNGDVILDNISLTFAGGRITILKGKSGRGKTTLLRLIAGLEQPDFGKVLTPGGNIAVMFQEDRLFSHISAQKNVTAVLPKGSEKIAEQLLGELGLNEDDCKKKPGELSGGMKRRAALARTLLYGSLKDCGVVLLDEPFKGLDPESKAAAAAAVEKYAADKTVIIVTHDGDENIFENASVISL